MRLFRLASWTSVLALLAVAASGWLCAPGRAASAAPAAPQDGCWNLKTTICTDCADADSKYCDPRASEGPFTSCIQVLTEPCPGFTCSEIEVELGPPCS